MDQTYDLYRVYTLDFRRSTFYVGPGEDADIEMRCHLAAHHIAPADVVSCTPAGYRTLDIRPQNTPFTSRAI